MQQELLSRRNGEEREYVLSYETMAHLLHHDNLFMYVNAIETRFKSPFVHLWKNLAVFFVH